MRKNKFFGMLVLFVAVFLMLSPGNIYGKPKKIVKDDSAVDIYMVYGDSFDININAIKKKLKIPKTKGKMKIYTTDWSVLSVNKKGHVTVKKSTKNHKNWARGNVYVDIEYKDTVYKHISSFVIYYEYDDDNPGDSNDLQKSLIKKFKKAYQTNNTTKLSKNEKKLFVKVKKAADYAKAGENRYEKVKLLNDYLAQNIVYSYDNNKKNHTAEGALLRGKAACEGFADAFKLCAEILGIPCERIDGYIPNNRIAGHAWNIVKLDDNKWYHVDVTFNNADDSNRYFPASYNALCLTDKQMKVDHRWYDTKKCNGKKYCFTNYEKSRFVRNDSELFDAIVSDVNENKTESVLYESFSYSAVNISSKLVSDKCGKLVEIEKITNPGTGEKIISNWTLHKWISPDNQEYSMQLFKIKYLSDTNPCPIQYVSSLEQIISIITEAVNNGATEIKNVAFKEGSLEEQILNEESLYALFHKHISMYTGTAGEGISAEHSPDGCAYILWDIYVDYSSIGDKVYEVSNDVEAATAFADAVSKGLTKFYIYAPNYPKERLQYMNSAYYPYPGNVSNIHIQISSYGYLNPCSKQIEPSVWLEVEVTYAK